MLPSSMCAIPTSELAANLGMAGCALCKLQGCSAAGRCYQQALRDKTQERALVGCRPLPAVGNLQ